MQRGGVETPHALETKCPKVGYTWAWFWMFPSPTLSIDPRSGVERRHHLYEDRVQRALKKAVPLVGICKGVWLLSSGTLPIVVPTTKCCSIRLMGSVCPLQNTLMALSYSSGKPAMGKCRRVAKAVAVRVASMMCADDTSMFWLRSKWAALTNHCIPALLRSFHNISYHCGDFMPAP